MITVSSAFTRFGIRKRSKHIFSSRCSFSHSQVMELPLNGIFILDFWTSLNHFISFHLHLTELNVSVFFKYILHQLWLF